MESYQQKFITNLKAIRTAKGITQAALAEKCNVSNGTIGNIECGKTKPSFDLIFQIAEALDISPKELFDFGLSSKDAHLNKLSVFQKKIIQDSISLNLQKALELISSELEDIK